MLCNQATNRATPLPIIKHLSEIFNWWWMLVSVTRIDSTEAKFLTENLLPVDRTRFNRFLMKRRLQLWKLKPFEWNGRKIISYLNSRHFDGPSKSLCKYSHWLNVFTWLLQKAFLLVEWVDVTGTENILIGQMFSQYFFRKHFNWLNVFTWLEHKALLLVECFHMTWTANQKLFISNQPSKKVFYAISPKTNLDLTIRQRRRLTTT